MSNFNIIRAHSDFQRHRYYIDCPTDTWNAKMEPGIRATRMEIPRQLAEYIYKLQTENERLVAKLKCK